MVMSPVRESRISLQKQAPTSPQKRPTTPKTPKTPSQSPRARLSKAPPNKQPKAVERASNREEVSTNFRDSLKDDNNKKNCGSKPKATVSWGEETREGEFVSSDEAGVYYTSSSYAASSGAQYTSDDRSTSGSSMTDRRSLKLQDREQKVKLPSPRKSASRGVDSRTRKPKRSTSTRYSDMTFQFLSSYNDKNFKTSRVVDDEQEHEKNLRALHNKATKHLKDGEYSLCLSIFEDILRSHVHQYDKQNYRVAAALHNIAIVQLRDGKLDEALDAIEEAVRIRKLAFGDATTKVADSLNELGIILLSRKEFHESIEAFNDALEITEKEFGKQDIRVCKILNNIGCIYFEYGDYAAADKIFQETIAMQQKLQSDKTHLKDKPGALTSMSTLCNSGYVYVDSAQYQKAINVLEKALATQMAVLDKGNKLILNTLDNLGYANAQDGDYDKAVCHYDQLLALQTKQMGRNHIEISETLMKIVWVHVKLYEWEEAREKLERIKKIQVSNNADSRKLSKTDRLINEVTYQLLKYTSFSETVAVSLTSAGVRNPFTGRKLDFAFLRPPTDDMTASIGTLKKPINSSKMSGHKLNYS